MAAKPGESIGDSTAGIKSAVAVDISSTDWSTSRITRGLYVGALGDVKVQFCDDGDSATVTLTGLAAGVWHPMQVQKVIKTGTTATGIVAGF